jgi:hypothetical protein
MGRKHKYTIDETFFTEIDSHAKAQVLGFLFADASLYVKPSGYGMLTLTVSRIDEDYVRWISDTLKSTRPVVNRSYHRPNGATRHSTTFEMNHARIISDLQRLGLTPRKSLTLQFPTPDQVPPEFIDSFILGYFEGDGCAYLSKPTAACRTKRAKACFVGSWDFITTLQRVLSKRGIKSATFTKISKNGTRFLTMEINTLNDVMRFYDFAYANAAYRMERKHAKFVEYKAQYRIATDGRYELINRNYSEDLRKRITTMARAKAQAQFSKPIHLKAPDGTIYFADVLKEFCAEMRLDRGNASLVARGLRSNLKGWTLPTADEISAARANGSLIKKRYRQPAATLLPEMPVAPVIPLAPAIAA